MALGILLVVVVAAGLVLAQNEVQPFRFAVIGDLQQLALTNIYRNVTWKLVRDLATTDAELVVIVGDLVHALANTPEASAEAWRQFDELMTPVRAAGKIIWAVPGNHDVRWPQVARGFEERFGARYQALTHRGVNFVLLDSEADRTAVSFRYLGWPQWQWLKTRPWRHGASGWPPLTFAFLHRPPLRSEIKKLDALNWFGHDQFELVEFARQQHWTAVFAGHEHLFYEREVNGVWYYITGGGGGQLLPTGFHHYLLVSVDPIRGAFKAEVRRPR